MMFGMCSGEALLSQVLGVAVAWGRLWHLLEEAAPGHGGDAELLLELFVTRELPRTPDAWSEPGDTGSL